MNDDYNNSDFVWDGYLNAMKSNMRWMCMFMVHIYIYTRRWSKDRRASRFWSRKWAMVWCLCGDVPQPQPQKRTKYAHKRCSFEGRCRKSIQWRGCLLLIYQANQFNNNGNDAMMMMILRCFFFHRPTNVFIFDKILSMYILSWHFSSI